MSKVVRMSDIMINRLEEYRNFKIKRATLLLPCCPSYSSDIELYKNMSYSDLIEDSILFALVACENDVENLSKIDL